MRVLLSDGSGLTARQTARLLARAGHEVGILTPGRLTLARLTGAVRHRHAVPPYGPDPLGWARAALAVLDRHPYDVLLPTQEQVGAISLIQPELAARGVATAVPDFAALRRVQDKLAAEQLLVEVGLPRPGAYVAVEAADLYRATWWPAFVKTPIGTASRGVRYLTGPEEVAGLDYPVLVQRPVPGPLLMVQAVFAHGELLALHANRRDRTGTNGGASHKTSVPTGPLRPAVTAIGQRLDWHGALSLDAIDGPDGPVVIDVNPRLVEPGNADAAGVDLVGTLLAVATRAPARPGAGGRAGVRTHQMLLGLLGLAGRRAIAREVAAAVRHRGAYRDSTEELTPWRGDRLGAAALVGLVGGLLVAPGRRHRLIGGSVAQYALTPDGWRQLLQAADRRPIGRGGHAGAIPAGAGEPGR